MVARVEETATGLVMEVVVDDALDVTVCYLVSSRTAARLPCFPPNTVVLTAAHILAICSVMRFMVWVVGCPTIMSRGSAIIIIVACTVSRHDVPGAVESSIFLCYLREYN